MLQSSVCLSAKCCENVRRRQCLAIAAANTTSSPAIKDSGAYTVLGKTRKQNEDRYTIEVSEDQKVGNPYAFVGVFDGHGGYAASQWLEENLLDYIAKEWQDGKLPEACLSKGFLRADKYLLTPGGFMGMGERGIGGSKCGSTAAIFLLFKETDGSTKLLTGNCGDARILLISSSGVEQLSEDHVPDSEAERERIESMNPNPKFPLVRYVGGTWRVGGKLALSRAFGDAYMKSSLQFEGLAAGSNYSSGFGVVAEPYTTCRTLTGEDYWLVVSSDGLYDNEERGGGGGLTNQLVLKMLQNAGSKSCEQLAAELGSTAQKNGSTDDVTVVVTKLQ
eukprot:TRINITY_DN10173_c0_g1_i3.p1 TRINITY_DN10173_c0_g1~~TRINITY_DN10173_c0_g1_i3.p1  ORF type:complete len:334 (+),score=80.27 TRINITY_DN10173_c0_g1_i3:349-1350(+)